MEIVRNAARIRRYRLIANAASITGLAVLGVGLVLSFQGNPTFFLAQWLTLVIGILLWQVSLNFSHRYVRSPRPDEELDEALKGTSYKSILYHYALPANHVLLTRAGPILFIIKPQTGKIAVEGEHGDRWKLSGSLYRRIFGQQQALGNPTREAVGEVTALVNFIKEKAPELEELPVGAIIVFTAPQAMVTLDIDASRIPALHIDELKKFVNRQLGRPLPPEQFKQLRAIFDEAAAKAGALEQPQEAAA